VPADVAKAGLLEGDAGELEGRGDAIDEPLLGIVWGSVAGSPAAFTSCLPLCPQDFDSLDVMLGGGTFVLLADSPALAMTRVTVKLASTLG
jgi:hypothetical protein